MSLQTSTYFAILAEFNSASIELAKVSQKYFGLSLQEANRKANLKQLPIAAFRCGNQKASWMIHAEDLATLIDTQRKKAERDWQQMNGRFIKEIPSLTDDDIDNLRHMLGASLGKPKKSHGYRNYFAAEKGPQLESMQRLEQNGMVKIGNKTENLTYYHATKKGCNFIGLHKAAIEMALGDL